MNLEAAVQTTEHTETHGKEQIARGTFRVNRAFRVTPSVPCHSVSFRGLETAVQTTEHTESHGKGAGCT